MGTAGGGVQGRLSSASQGPPTLTLVSFAGNWGGGNSFLSALAQIPWGGCGYEGSLAEQMPSRENSPLRSGDKGQAFIRWDLPTGKNCFRGFWKLLGESWLTTNSL